MEKRTRTDRYEKRRKNTKSISILLGVGIVLLISLISIWLFGGGDNEAVDDSSKEQPETSEVMEEDEDAQEAYVQNDESEAGQTNTTEESELENEHDENNQSIVTEEVEPSDDNVIRAYTADWEPVGTEQEEPHIVSFDKESQDWLEMKEAILLATGLNENDYHAWWIGNGGDQKAIATVSDKEETEVYRVYLSWVTNEGWQPTKVELLKENDWEKYRN
ncbi:YrrS family protein [Oceanobacillus salinisoli]|uniref:YrrS family protein n=1 Tax=Oceanobacillus salinisoli TaxID=2678611 RepID=UPI0012E11C2C|nr:YrrS family protein [Oceanobacillus salinisoli]